MTAGLLRAAVIGTAGLFLFGAIAPASCPPCLSNSLFATFFPFLPLPCALLARVVVVCLAGEGFEESLPSLGLLLVDLESDSGNDERRDLVRACLAAFRGLPVRRRFFLPRVGMPFSM